MLSGLISRGSVVVAYSGGADSTALLLMALEAARARGGTVRAIHVHHGLQPAADDFAAHAQAFCANLGVACEVVRVDARAAAGQSPEDAARRARYLAIAGALTVSRSDYAVGSPDASEIQELNKNPTLAGIKTAPTAIDSIASATPSDAENLPTVLLAQHADDQVETMLLALSRGAGVDGMAGMATEFERHGLRWARPFLMPETFMGAQDIRAWLAGRGLKAREPGSANLGVGWVEDPTNASEAYTRNRIRKHLLPALQSVFPQYRETFTRTARNMAQAGELLAQGAIDLIASVGMPPQIKALQTLSHAAQANYLRHWLKSQHGVAGSEAQMQELQSQIAACTTRTHRIDIRFASGRVLREADVLKFVA